jgi:hypothetical protein
MKKKIIKRKRKIKRIKETKRNFFKKSLCTKEDSSSSDEEEDSDNNTERVLFMEVEYSEKILRKKEKLISEKN